jgi:DMSO/TMAO reductase YedYZ heme-binding membrane subunit
MRPSVVILGFVLGSAAAITFALLGVAIAFAVLRADYPRFDDELPGLLQSAAAFLLLTAAAAASFYAQLKRLAWRWPATGLLVIVLAATVLVHWQRWG